MRFLIGVVLGAVAWFVWGFIFWSLLPYAQSVFQTIPNEAAVVQVLRANLPDSGPYLIPGGDAMDEAWAERHRQGPLGVLMYHAAGAEPMDSAVMLQGFLHMLGSSLLLAIVLATAGRRTYAGRFLLCFWIGLFVAIWAEMSNVIWFRFPLSYACLQQTFHVTSLLIVGAILALFVRPPGDEQND